MAKKAQNQLFKCTTYFHDGTVDCLVTDRPQSYWLSIKEHHNNWSKIEVRDPVFTTLCRTYVNDTEESCDCQVCIG